VLRSVTARTYSPAGSTVKGIRRPCPPRRARRYMSTQAVRRGRSRMTAPPHSMRGPYRAPRRSGSRSRSTARATAAAAPAASRGPAYPTRSCFPVAAIPTRFSLVVSAPTAAEFFVHASSTSRATAYGSSASYRSASSCGGESGDCRRADRRARRRRGRASGRCWWTRGFSRGSIVPPDVTLVYMDPESVITLLAARRRTPRTRRAGTWPRHGATQASYASRPHR
jgi:hypothetical protein